MRKINWGMPTLIELSEIEENINLCRSLNLDFLELNMNLPEYQPNQIDIEKFVNLKEANKLFYTIHLAEEFDIANFNEQVSDAYLKVFTDTVDIAKRLDAPIINMHMNPGVYFTLPNKRVYLYEKYMQVYLDKIMCFGDYVEDILRESEVKLAIENTGIYDLNFVKEAVNQLLRYENIILTWDIGHDFSSNLKDYDYIIKNIKKLKHMHIHDAIGRSNHLPLFTGEIDIMNRLEIAASCNCSCVLETKTVEGLKESVLNLISKGMLND